tara:strand:- start:27 stop:761 length:735 start_codon:yes stop_codon:yes gene_type:complete
MRELNIKKNKIIAIILARSGSKSIKHKNLKKLKGKPLISWAIEACKRSKMIKKIFFCTDSIRYGKIAKKYGAHEIIIRPKFLSLDSTPDLKTLKFAIKKIKDLGENSNTIAHVRPTTPFRKVKVFDNAIKKFLRSKKATSLRTVHEMPETAYKSYEIDTKKNKLKMLKNLKIDIEMTNFPRQIFPKTYLANGLIDIYRTETILKNNKLLGKYPIYYLTNFTHEIDSPDELRYLKYLSKSRKIVS